MSLPSLNIRSRSVHLAAGEPPVVPGGTLRLAVNGQDAVTPLAGLARLAELLGISDQPAVRDVLAWRHRDHPAQPIHLHASFRRLSRETNRQCAAYQDVAQALAAALRKQARPGLIVEDVARLDLPTLLILGQVIIASEGTPVQFWLVTRPHLTPCTGRPHEEARLTYARRFFARVAPLVVNPSARERLEASFAASAADLRPPPVLGAEDALQTVHHCTALLAYDAAYLSAELALDTAESGVQTTQLHETLVLLDLNVTGPEAAIQRAEQAVHATSGVPRARMAYALGVLQAKRAMNDQAAERTLLAGLDALGGARTPSARLERAWLTNALGLVAALRTARIDARERDLGAALNYEVQALDEVANDHHAEADYLRANVATNQVTAFEMMGDLPRAVELWQSLTTDSAVLSDRQCAFAYRLGGLHLKAGRAGEARALFEEALDAATSVWTAGRARLALAMAAHAEGKAVQARTHLIRLAWESRAAHHWAGVLEALQALHHWQLEIVPADDIRTAAHLAQVTSGGVSAQGDRPASLKPRSKLPACAPHIDLGALQELDFTRSLITRTLAPSPSA